jgi:hypothetical protein
MWLVVESGPEAGHSARIEGKTFTIGSAVGSGLRVEHHDVEPHHATITIGDDGELDLRDEPGTAAAAAGLEGVLLTRLNGSPLDGTIAGYCSAVEGTETGDTVDAEAVVAPGGAPRALTVEMD